MALDVSTTERRFRENLGQRYMKDGITVRCQACSKTKLRRLRLEQDNPNLTSDEAWPVAQCEKPAEPGTFACLFHGGPSTKPRSLLDVLPVDLREMVVVVSENSDLASRRQDILLLTARNAQLFERLAESEEQPGAISLGDLQFIANKISKGEIVAAQANLQALIDAGVAELEMWSEIRTNMELIRKQVATQTDLYRTLKDMATPEQVMAIYTSFQNALLKATDRYISDPAVARQFLRFMAEEAFARANDRMGEMILGDVVEVSNE